MSEHQHIPIPEIVKGRVPENIGMRPQSNRCVICGFLVIDQPIVLEMWERFLMREMEGFAETHMLCISLGWDFEELRKLGAQHLAERHTDFKRDGWSEVGKENNSDQR